MGDPVKTRMEWGQDLPPAQGSSPPPKPRAVSGTFTSPDDAQSHIAAPTSALTTRLVIHSPLAISPWVLLNITDLTRLSESQRLISPAIPVSCWQHWVRSRCPSCLTLSPVCLEALVLLSDHSLPLPTPSSHLLPSSCPCLALSMTHRRDLICVSRLT